MVQRAYSSMVYLVLGMFGCGGGNAEPEPAPVGPPVTDAETFGATYSGSYHLGPVDWAETEWHNACAPYPRALQTLTGVYLAGVDNSLAGDGSLCDACAKVTTRLGRSIVVRLVTYGVSNSPGDMDLSPEAFDAIHEQDPGGTPANPRPMTWQLAKCPESGNIYFQYQTEANVWWTSLWVRTGKLPIDRLEVRSANHASFFALARGTDGTFTDAGGFGEGEFELRVTGRGGQALSQSFAAFTPGALVESSFQFQ
jgi:expansin (peptidoglycan-binding protein)